MDTDFEAFVHAAQARLLHFGHALTGNPHDAADLTQAALERVGLRWSRVRRTEHPVAYTKQVMARLHVSAWRRVRREALGASGPELAQVEADPVVATPMWVALATLPPRQRAVLVLRYYEDLSEQQIADVLGVRPGTVKSQAARGLATLREHWLAANPSDEPKVDR